MEAVLVYHNDAVTGNPAPQTQTDGAADVNIASGQVAIDQNQNMVKNRLFPVNATNIRLAITATVLAPTLIPGTGSSVRLVNEGPNTCYVAIGSANVVAVVPSSTPSADATPLLAGEDVIFSRDVPGASYISAICASNQTAALNVAAGEGI